MKLISVKIKFEKRDAWIGIFWDAYSKECYADSTLKRVHEPPVAYQMGERLIFDPCFVD